MKVKLFILIFSVILFFPRQMEAQDGFKKCGFYLHEGWFFNYPFAVRTWEREDFNGMFRLLKAMGYDQVGIWPMLEAIPMPLSREDRKAIKDFRHTIDDAQKAALECWIMQCPNLTPDGSVRSLPWHQRNPYPVWKSVRLDDPLEADKYFAHRTAMMSVLNNADAYVTIDGDPGGYPGARPEDWLKVFSSDRKAIERYGTNPAVQKVIPWVWCGWGTDKVWGGNPNNPPARIRSYSESSMKIMKESMPEPWELLPGRSHRSNWANGRINILLADSLGLMNRSTILCYEAIEFEPVPPAANLQFDIIRSILKEESKYAKVANGVFGNAQQPVMVIPGIWFFVKGSKDLSYLDKTDEEVLTDLAHFLGGPPELLVPAWECLSRDLASLSPDLPGQLLKTRLNSENAANIPGGSGKYLEILSEQVRSRIGLLQAVSGEASNDAEASQRIVSAIKALQGWWNVHKYVLDRDPGEPFGWRYVHGSQVNLLREWCRNNIRNRDQVLKSATESLKNSGIENADDLVAKLLTF